MIVMLLYKIYLPLLKIVKLHESIGSIQNE